MNKFSKLLLIALVSMSTLASCTKDYYQMDTEEDTLIQQNKTHGEGKDTNDQSSQGTGG